MGMGTGAVIGIVAGGLAVAGVGGYFLLRKKGVTAPPAVGWANPVPGAAHFQAGPNQMVGSATAQVGPAAASGTGPMNVMGLAKGAVGGYLNKIAPGTGQYAGAAIGAASSVLKKIPGIGNIGSKLKFW